MSAPVESLDPDLFGPDQPCFGCSPRHPTGFRLRFAREGDTVTTRFLPGQEHQGPPSVMHGGLVLALGDELAAWTVVGLKERFGFTAAVEARLLRPVRIGVEVNGRGAIELFSSRVVKVRAVLSQEQAEVFKGHFTFALVDEAGAERILGGPLPEAWRRFSR